MPTNYSTTNQSYKHLSEAERGEIEAYLSVGLKPAEIARRLGRNRSTITREINRGSITQLKKVNGQKVYYQHYYADAAHNRYRDARETSYYLKIEGLDVYFAHAYSSYERGTNENFNGLLREFIPKGSSLKKLNPTLLEDYTKAINERPRRIHGYQSAKKLFELTQTA